MRGDSMSYEVIVYKITVNDTGKKYIGYHKGKFDGTYHHSSKCPVFMKDFAEGNNTIDCVATGTVIDMATLEHNMLLKLTQRIMTNTTTSQMVVVCTSRLLVSWMISWNFTS